MKSRININPKITGIATAIIIFLISDFAEAQYGYGVVRRTTRRRTAVVVGSVTTANNQQSAKEQQPPPPHPPPAAETIAGESFPVGTVVTKLPEGCVSTTVGDEQYHHCGPNYFHAVYQNGTLVYVTTEPPG